MAHDAAHAGAGIIMNHQRLSERCSTHRVRALIQKGIPADSARSPAGDIPDSSAHAAVAAIRFCLSATVSNIRLGVVDDSRTPESRELIATLTESKSFRAAGYYASVDQLGDALSRNQLDAGVVIPYDYVRGPRTRPNRYRAVPAERDECQYRRDRARICGGRAAKLTTAVWRAKAFMRTSPTWPLPR